MNKFGIDALKLTLWKGTEFVAALMVTIDFINGS